jgi:hypothetical protein
MRLGSMFDARVKRDDVAGDGLNANLITADSKDCRCTPCRQVHDADAQPGFAAVPMPGVIAAGTMYDGPWVKALGSDDQGQERIQSCLSAGPLSDP